MTAGDGGLVDAEVRATRRAMVQAVRGRGADAGAFLDEGFLTVADRVTICPAVDAAVNMSVGGLC